MTYQEWIDKAEELNDSLMSPENFDANRWDEKVADQRDYHLQRGKLQLLEDILDELRTFTDTTRYEKTEPTDGTGGI